LAGCGERFEHRHPHATPFRLLADQDCAPSATIESISTPRFIGPGCITSASGWRSEFFLVEPEYWKYSLDDARTSVHASRCNRSIIQYPRR